MPEIFGLEHVLSTFQETVWSHLKLYVHFEWSLLVPLKNNARATLINSPFLTLVVKHARVKERLNSN